MARSANWGEQAPAEEGWHPARLIPTAGIKGIEEQEKRATSALLAVMRAVPEFSHALLTELKAPKGRITTFAEIQLKDSQGKTSIPDGAIVVTRGQKTWRALVEVKTSTAPLKAEQFARYLEMAREHGFDAVLTISNDIRRGRDEMPVEYDKRKVGRLKLCHLSWWADTDRGSSAPPLSRSLGPGPGLDLGGADRLSEPRELRSEWVSGHGGQVGFRARRRPCRYSA